jgi:hypothetical protein
LPIDWCAAPGRPVAALADARTVSADFEVVRTLDAGIRALKEFFDWDSLNDRCPVANLWQSRRLQCFRRGSDQRNCLAIWDEAVFDLENLGAPRILFESDPSVGYRSRGGVELPVAGLRIWQVRDDTGRIHDLRTETVMVRPRF